MSFLQPWAVWFLAGVPLIVALYLMRLKRRELTVSTHLFWQRVLGESSRRAFFHRLRHLWSLLLNLLIFLLVVAALARPLFFAPEHEASRTVVVLDARARMQALEPDGRTRFQHAVALAQTYFRQASTRRQFALVTLAGSAEVAVPFTDDSRGLVAAAQRADPTDAPGAIEEGVELARKLLAGRSGDSQIVVLTDRPLDHAAASTAPLTVVHAFGSARDNVAITRFAARAHPATPSTAELLVELQNFGKTEVRTELDLSLDGRTFEVKPVAVKPGESRTEIVASVPRLTRGARGWLAARLGHLDALPLDNVAYATLPVRPPRRVLLVSAGNPFLEKLLAVDPAARFQLLAPEAWKDELAAKFEVVIFDRFVPAGFNAAQPAGNFLFIGKTPFASESPPLGTPLVTEVDTDHPGTRNLTLQNVAIQRAEAMRVPAPEAGWQYSTPIQSFDEPLLITGTSGSRRIAALAFDILKTDLPLRVAFPLLISNLCAWLDARSVEAPASLVAGETLLLQPGQNISTQPARDPAVKISSESVQTGVFQPARNGYYLLGQGDQEQWIAVNTFSREESDLRLEPGAAPPLVRSEGIAAGFHARPPWFWLTCLALALFTGEWWLFHRRKTE